MVVTGNKIIGPIGQKKPRGFRFLAANTRTSLGGERDESPSTASRFACESWTKARFAMTTRIPALIPVLLFFRSFLGGLGFRFNHRFLLLGCWFLSRNRRWRSYEPESLQVIFSRRASQLDDLAWGFTPSASNALTILIIKVLSGSVTDSFLRARTILSFCTWSELPMAHSHPGLALQRYGN
jgi:hypothetical protein